MFTNTILPTGLGVFRVYSVCLGWGRFVPPSAKSNLGEKGNNQKTVLCIDDQALPLLIRKILLIHAGYAVLTAEAPLAGLQLFASEEVHAVVLHYSREDMDSGVVAARMKDLKPETPIILLFGGVAEPVDAVPAVDVFIKKPESPNILLAKLSEVLYSDHASPRKKAQKAKPTKTKWVA
jgi:response regulator RpfG family c-di-GMP phosphodiesterase